MLKTPQLRAKGVEGGNSQLATNNNNQQPTTNSQLTPEPCWPPCTLSLPAWGICHMSSPSSLLPPGTRTKSRADPQVPQTSHLSAQRTTSHHHHPASGVGVGVGVGGP
eukprot:scaffold15486_cov111-Isochrysis_galbana.AAC.1